MEIQIHTVTAGGETETRRIEIWRDRSAERQRDGATERDIGTPVILDDRETDTQRHGQTERLKGDSNSQGNKKTRVT